MFELLDLLIFGSALSKEVFLLLQNFFELLFKSFVLFLSISDQLLLLLNESEHSLNLNLNVEADSLLLIDVTLPNFNSKSFVCKLLLIVDLDGVGIGNLSKVLNHVSKDFNLLFDNFFVLTDQLSMHSLKFHELSVLDFSQLLGFVLFFLACKLDDHLVLSADLLHIFLNLKIN